MSRRKPKSDALPGSRVEVICTGGGTHPRRVLDVVRVHIVGGVIQVAHQRQGGPRSAPWMAGEAFPSVTEHLACDSPGCRRRADVPAEVLEAALADVLAGGESVVDIADLSG